MGQRRMRQVLIRLRPGRDDDIIAAFDAISVGDREARMREALRWYLVPGGFGALIQRLERLGDSGVRSAVAEPTSTPPPAARMAATAQALATAMAEFGWDEE